MKQEEYKGTIANLSNSEFLAAEDIFGLGDLEVEIEKVMLLNDVATRNGKKENNVLGLKFVGSSKMLWVGGPNKKTLAVNFTADTKKWVGQKIKLYTVNGVRRPDGTFGPAIRIKSDSTAAKSAQAAASMVNKTQGK